MKCHRCDQPAVDRCYTCGRLYCENHGAKNCVTCAGAIAVGDPRPDRITAGFALPEPPAHAWWRPQTAEDYEPPACYECKGLARPVCTNCGRRYCPEHAGKNGWCAACQKATRSGNLFLTFFFLLLVGMLALSWLQLHGW